VLFWGGEIPLYGWVKDRFGGAWQIVPDFVLAVDEGTDTAAAERMNVALIGMNKIDITPLHQASDAEAEGR
jgi:predicted 3-demethylubiquinone-9 3-methyltransferase (glyoxalase superfamily)